MARRKRKGTQLRYTWKSDVLFKMIFVKYPDLLKRLICVLLGISYASVEKFELTDTEIPPEEVGKKFCRLDVNMIIDGKRVNLEIQVNDEKNYPERLLFHWAREYSSALKSGHNYSLLPKTIIISIVDFIMFDDNEVHSEFQALEVKRHIPLSDKFNVHVFELPKLSEQETLTVANERDLWLALFNAETEEELEALERMEVDIMTQAVSAYRTVSASEKFRTLEKIREKTRHDEAQALYNKEKQTELNMAKNLLNLGVSHEVIAQSSGLTIEEIERIER